MNKINEILDYGLLSEFAYLKLENENFIYDKPKVVNAHNREEYSKKYNIHNKEDIISFLKGEYKDGKPIKIKMGKEYIDLTDKEYKNLTDIDRSQNRVEVMIDLLDRYKIIDFTSDDGYFSSDFQAMLLQNISTKEYIIAFRGTSSVKDGFVDSALANLSLAHNFQLDEAVEFIKNMKEKYEFENDSLTLCGHSLGAILAQYLGCKLSIKTFTFNALGTSTLENGLKVSILLELLEKFNIIDIVDEDFINKNIINISYNDVGSLNGDILSNFATKLNISRHLGLKIDFFGKDVAIGDGHSIITINKLLEDQSMENLSTIEDIKNYNKTQKTLFLDIMKKEKNIDMVALVPADKKCLFAVQSNTNIENIISTDLAKKLKHKNMHSFMINANITEQEDKNNFFNKLTYFPNENKLKVKVKDFKDSNKLIIPFLEVNKELKKHRVITVLQGES